ncbi:cathepsin B isoform X2 [Bemisia tabaci]|uniref:cathepsin B isoform X2 n=1 Tax=Bemisia tabaci TaxID=7038 RepID=UPI003B286847
MHLLWVNLISVICLGDLPSSFAQWGSDYPSLSTLIEDLKFLGGELGEYKDMVPSEVEQQVSALRDIDQFCPNSLDLEDVQLPRVFDARNQWKECAGLIETPWDQGNCRSSSVLAVASMAADRLCISSNGTVKSTLSAQYLMACGSACETNELLSTPLEFMKHTGIPTGSPYASDNTTRSGCVPYEIMPCNHSNTPVNPDEISLEPCDYNDKYSPLECPEECTNPVYPKKLDEDYYKWIYRHYGYGPYIRIQHVKIIGWGVEKKVPYWLGVNFFGDAWGMNGLFKFFRGRNHLFIETMVAAGRF